MLPEESQKQRQFVNLPTVLTLAATEEADKEGDDDNRAKHWQRNDQGLEVYWVIKKIKSSVRSRALSSKCLTMNTPVVLCKKMSPPYDYWMEYSNMNLFLSIYLQLRRG